MLILSPAHSLAGLGQVESVGVNLIILHSAKRFCSKKKKQNSAVVSYLLDFLVQHPEELLLALRRVDAPAGTKDSSRAGQRRGRRKPAGQLYNRRNLQYLPVWTSFIWGLVFTEEGAFLLQEKLKSKIPPPWITNEPTKAAVNDVLETRGRHPLCCPSRPLLPHRRWGTWLSPLLSSCTHLWRRERKRSTHTHLLLMHHRQRASLGAPPPLVLTQGLCFTDSESTQEIYDALVFFKVQTESNSWTRPSVLSTYPSALKPTCTVD